MLFIHLIRRFLRRKAHIVSEQYRKLERSTSTRRNKVKYCDGKPVECWKCTISKSIQKSKYVLAIVSDGCSLKYNSNDFYLLISCFRTGAPIIFFLLLLAHRIRISAKKRNSDDEKISKWPKAYFWRAISSYSYTIVIEVRSLLTWLYVAQRSDYRYGSLSSHRLVSFEL